MLISSSDGTSCASLARLTGASPHSIRPVDFSRPADTGSGAAVPLLGDILDTPSAHQLWTAALGQLEVEIPRPNFETWLRGTSASSLNDGVLTITTPSAFAAEMLEHRLSNTIERVVERIARSPLEIEFHVHNGPGRLPSHLDSTMVPDSSGSDEVLARSVCEPSTAKSPSAFKGLRPELTLDNFISGPANQLAHAAASQVAEAPGAAFNPLYIYSDVGLGKTHLIQGIGHQLVGQGLQVTYVSAERFTNEFIKAIRDGATEEFRAHYRNVDALLIDDIQFIATKPQTQEGFFHTFNELHMAGKQIVITGDKPAERVRLEQRIQSRLEGGLVVDIQPPDYELRYAILQHKMFRRETDVPHAVLDAIASKQTGNVRELEGALNRVIAYAQLTGEAIDLTLADKALSNIGSKRAAPPDAESVLATVAAHTGVAVEMITGKKRDRRTSSARRLAAYILREDARMPVTQIGDVLGGKDHSSVLYAHRKFSEELSSSSESRLLLNEVRRVLRQTATVS
jgi:chromosomal replication initiator protein